jgi:hypothetical protein
MPSFTRGKKQLSAMEVHKSKCLSNVRIHVERVIGKMRNYLILQSTIPVNQVRLLDDIVVIIIEKLTVDGVQLPDPYGITKSCWDNDVNKWSDISYPDIYINIY